MSGATLTTSLPATVSPSRLLQASTFLTAGDTQYSMNPGIPVQAGPPFTLTLWMLFTAHTAQMHDDETKKPNWKEVMHKARVKLMRVPLDPLFSNGDHDGSLLPSIEGGHISGEGKQNEYAYRLEIIEDLDDGRAHSYEEGEAPPSPYGDIQLAGIREFLPIHQISKIFYVNTGKILGIDPEGEANIPALLFKRDVNAQAPRRMMQENERSSGFDDYEDEREDAGSEGTLENDDNDIDKQIRREISVVLPNSPAPAFQPQPANSGARHLPPDLDLEWLALSVYTEEEEDSSSDDEQEEERDANDDSAYVSHRPSSSGVGLNAASPNLAAKFANLGLNPVSSPPSNPNQTLSPHKPVPTPFPQIRSSLSLLEMLIRLTALQQFQQTSHLSVPDEFLTFFLEESSTTGAGPAAEERRRARHDARMKVGFDPYDESPIKRHGEEYQYGQPEDQGWDGYSPARSRAGTPYREDVATFPSSPGQYFEGRERNPTPSRTQPWLHQSSSRRNSPLPVPLPASSPVSPYRGQRKGPVERLQKENHSKGNPSPSPLGQGGFGGHGPSDTDSTLGMSPGIENVTLVDGKEKI